MSKKHSLDKYIDNKGLFIITPECKKLMETIETLIFSSDLDPDDVETFATIQLMLETPVHKTMQVVNDLLEDIKQRGIQSHLDSLDDSDTTTLTIKEEEKPVVYHYFKDKDKEEDATIPMSLVEIDNWYRLTQGVIISNWYQSSHADKYKMMQDHLAEKEREDRDLTDEEMLEELEGAEQSD